MMADELKLSITLDTGEVVQGFINVEKQAKKTSDGISKNFSDSSDDIKDGIDKISPTLGNLANNLSKALSSPIGIITTSVVALGAAITKSFDLTLAGEKLLKIDKQFESLTQNAGIAGDRLKDSFITSLDGLIDDSDAIESLNKSIVTLGSKAQQLPKVMELARKATNLFGGDVVNNFEAINQAIATGATRQLRAIGLIIDADQAYTKYAKSLGVTKDLLSESGRQQALLNEVLEKGEARFSGVAIKSDNLTESLQRLKVESNNAFEEFEKSFAKAFGPSATRLIDFFTEKLKGGVGLKELALTLLSPSSALAVLSTQSVQAAAGLDITVLSVEDLKKKLSDSYSAVDGFNKRIEILTEQRKETKGINSLARIDEELRRAKTGAIDAKKQIDALYAALSKKLGDEDLSSILPSGIKKPTIADDSIDQKLKTESEMKREKELTDFLAQQNQARLNSKIQTNVIALNNVLTNSARLALTEENLAAQDSIREEQRNQQIFSIKEKYRLANLTGSEFEALSLKAINDNFNQQQIQAEQNRRQQLKVLMEQSNFDTLSGFQAVAAGFSTMMSGMSEQALKETATISEAFKKLGEQIFSSVGSRVGSAFTAFGSALRKGEDAGKAFVGVMGQQIAQIASQIGNFFIQAGIARVAASYGADTTGYVMIAAGAALNIIGGFISASIGSGEGSTSDTGGGGVAATPATATTELSPAQKTEPNTNVQVIIQGDVLDSDESGSRIVDLVNKAFSKKGVVIQQGISA